MTTKADVKRLVAPILARNLDLVLVNRLLVIKPFRHIARGVFIDRQSDKDGLRPHWIASFLATQRDWLELNFGNTFFPNVGHYFSMSDPELPEKLRGAFEDFALPTLRPVKTIADFQRYATDGTVPFQRLEHHPFTKVCVDIAVGDLASALAICETVMAREAVYRELKYDDELQLIALLHPLVIDKDRKPLAALLHQWEEEAVNRLGLKPYWEPSPFPIEEI
jgi:hypothetical protein